MRLKLSTWTPIMIAGDCGGEPEHLRPPVPDVTRTWFNRTLWDGARTVKERRALIAQVKKIELENHAEPVRLGYVRR